MIEFKVDKVTRADTDRDIAVKIQFHYGDKHGSCLYFFTGESIGIDDCQYEEGDEDIYEMIHIWVNNHLVNIHEVFWNGNKVSWR